MANPPLQRECRVRSLRAAPGPCQGRRAKAAVGGERCQQPLNPSAVRCCASGVGSGAAGLPSVPSPGQLEERAAAGVLPPAQPPKPLPTSTCPKGSGFFLFLPTHCTSRSEARCFSLSTVVLGVSPQRRVPWVCRFPSLKGSPRVSEDKRHTKTFSSVVSRNAADCP